MNFRSNQGKRRYFVHRNISTHSQHIGDLRENASNENIPILNDEGSSIQYTNHENNSRKQDNNSKDLLNFGGRKPERSGIRAEESAGDHRDNQRNDR